METQPYEQGLHTPHMSTRRYCARDDITAECEVFVEGDPTEDSKVMCERCPKKEGHDKYIPVNELKMVDLPEECQTKEFMEGLSLRCDLTVMAIVRYTSWSRPKTYIDSDKEYPFSYLRGSNRCSRTGTGYIRPDSIHFPIKDKPCPCRLCLDSEGNPKLEYLAVSVFTATHLVFDNEEAKSTTFECFYDSADRTSVIRLYGLTVTDPDELKRCVNDSCVVNCVTHDPVLMKKLMKLGEKRGIISLANPSTAKGVIISHPHGLSKQISIGKILYCGVHKDPRLPNDVPYEFGKDAKCRIGPSSEADLRSTGMRNKNPSLFTFGLDTIVSPGNEYSLPPGMTFKLPLDSASFCTFQLPIKYSSKLWVKFPEGTEFFLLDGTRVMSLPPETEFCWSKGKASVNNKSCLYVTYDMVTCPGSSGATIFRCDNCWGIFPHFPHCGAQKDGHNRSSNIMLFCYYETWMAFPSIDC